MWSKFRGLAMTGAAMTALALLAAPAAGQEFGQQVEAKGTMKTIRDWLVACDNLRNCSAFGLGEEWNGAYVKITRSGARDATPTVAVAVDVPKGMTFSLAFDDPSLEGLPQGPQTVKPEDDESARIEITDPAAVERLIASLRKANKLLAKRAGTSSSQAGGPETSEVSLSGAVGALLYMDEQQGRLGTITAMIRRGDKPATAVPSVPRKAPITAAQPGKASIPAKPPAAILAKGKKICGEDNGVGEHTETQRLSGNLLLYWFSCREMSGAYNSFSGILVAPADRPEAARVPRFRVPAGFSDVQQKDAVEMLVNAGFSETDMTLSTFNKGRGLGDCGSSTSWVWIGTEFVLSSHSEMPRCAGVPMDEWPVLYQSVGK
jgi:hypothetical protein